MSIFVLFIFANPYVFAETEMIGSLQILVSHGPGDNSQPYSFWFKPDDQSTFYKLNPTSLPPNILDWAEERVKVTINDVSKTVIETSLNSNEQFLQITSIEVISPPEGILFSHTPPPLRSVTLLSKYLDIPTTPVEDPGRSPGQFVNPYDVAVDGSGNIYVIERGELSNTGHRVQKFDSSGNFLLKFGKFGTGDGEFSFPTGITVDSLGNIYVVGNNGDRVQKFDSNGVFLLKFGSTGSGDAEFSFPFGIDVDSSDNVYVADTSNHRIQKFDSNGVFQGWLGGCTAGANCVGGHSDGFLCTAATCTPSGPSLTNGAFNGPRDIVFDSADNFFVLQSSNDRIQKFDSNADFVTNLVGSGSAEGQFLEPHGIATDDTFVYVADAGNHRIQKFDSSLVFVSMWGWGVQDGTAALQTCTSGCQIGLAGSGVGQLDSPEGIESGSLYVADASNNRIKKYTSVGGFDSELGGVPDLVHDVAYYQDIFYDGTLSLKEYYNVSSYGHFILDGTASDWQTLPQNQATYLPNDNLKVTDSIAAHEGVVDFCNPTPVTNLLLVFNGAVVPGGGAAFGTLGTPATQWPTLDGCNIVTSISWLPDNGGGFCCGQDSERGIGTPAHELGHNIGFEHTPPPPGNWINEGMPPHDDPYHDPNSIMSTNTDNEGPSPLIMAQRDKVGWVDSGNKVEVADGTSGTFTLDFSNDPQGGVNPQMITVPLPDGTSYIIEGQEDGAFSDTPQDKKGIIIYKKIPGGNQYSYLTFDPNDKNAEFSLVATAGTESETDFDDAILELGETYTDVVNSVTVTTQSFGNSVTVFVSNNASQCAPQSGQNWEITESCALTGDVTADMNITVQNNSVLTIPDGMTLFFDPGTFKITVVSGSGILIEQGGSIQTTPP